MPPLPIYIFFERIRGYAAAPSRLIHDSFRLIWFLVWSTAFVAVLFALGYAIEHGLPHVMAELNYYVQKYLNARI